MNGDLANAMIVDGASFVLSKFHGNQCVEVGSSNLRGDIQAGGSPASTLVGDRYMQSVRFNGVAEYAIINSATTAITMSDPMSIVFWINYEDIGVDNHDVIEFGSDTNGFRIILDGANLVDPRVVTRVTVSSVATNRQTGNQEYLKPGITSMVALVLDTSAITFYIDGQTSNSSSSGVPIANVATSTMYLGRRKQVANPDYMSGSVGPVAVFPSALTQAQIINQMNLGKGI